MRFQKKMAIKDGYITVSGYDRTGGKVKRSMYYTAEPYKRKDGTKVKESKLQRNSSYERKGASVKAHKTKHTPKKLKKD